MLLLNRFHSVVVLKLVSHNTQFLQYPILRYLSTISDSITQDYLINSCGLTPEKALSITQKNFRLTCIQNSDTVLTFFKNHGFSKSQTAQVISKRPSFLCSNTDKILKPKMDFLQNLGVSSPNIASIVSSDPRILARGLSSSMIPSVEFLKTILGPDLDFSAIFKRSTWLFQTNLEKVMEPKVAILRSVGVPGSIISKLLVHCPRTFLIKVERFGDIVNGVKEMGFDPSSTMFVHAVRAMCGMSKTKVERKFEVYTELGWSKEEIMVMFRKQPACITISEKKIRSGVDFFTKTLKWNTAQISNNPTLLCLSMEKRILRRCAVLGVLGSKGFLLKKMSVPKALFITEKLFMEKFVNGFQETVPDVVKAYEGKLGFVGFEEELQKKGILSA